MEVHLQDPVPPAAPHPSGCLRRALREEMAGLHLRWRIVQAIVRLVPAGVGLRLRPILYRLAGVRIGHGTVLAGSLNLSGHGRPSACLRIGPHCYLNEQISINLEGRVILEGGVSVGMECLFLTATHELGPPDFRGGRVVARDVRIGQGAWLGARVIVLPGVTVGAGAVIGAGAVVTRDVPPNVLAAGVPAKVVRVLESA